MKMSMSNLIVGLLCSIFLQITLASALPRQALAERVVLMSSGSAEGDRELLEGLRALLSNSPAQAVRSSSVEHVRIDLAEAATAIAVRTALSGPKVRLVVATNMIVARAVQQIDVSVPLVFDGAADPVQMCLVDSIVHPGRSATGYTSSLPLERKMIESLHDAFPSLREVVVLIDGNNDLRPRCSRYPGDVLVPLPPCHPGDVHDAEVLRRHTDAIGFESETRLRGLRLRFRMLCDVEDFKTLKSVARGDRDCAGIVVPLHLLFYRERQSLVEALQRVACPVIYSRPYFVQVGGLMALTPRSRGEHIERTLELAAQVLRGAAPSSLPVQMPSGVELWINTRAARQSGLRPALRTLQRADRLVP